MPTLTTIIQHSFGSPSHSNLEEKETKGIQIGKEVKLSLFQMTSFFTTENAQDATRKLLALTAAASMNTVKLQDVKLIYRNPLHSYTLTMKNKKEKLRKESQSPLQQQK